MNSSKQYCVFMKNLIESQPSGTCPWIGESIYRAQVVNDVINKMFIIFVCILYLFCIMHYVIRNLIK